MKIVVTTLGCKVNKYESDALLYNLQLKGYEVTDRLEPADVYIINTCAVTQEAEKKSRQMIARCKKFNAKAKIFVCGCASQHNAKQFLEKGVTFVSGVAKKVKISDLLDASGAHVEKLPTKYEDDMLASQTRTRAYIKIQDGCNNFCSYCIIPYLRGRSRSRDIINIINEVALLPDSVKEIVLTGINVTDYQIGGQPGLLTLLEQLDAFGKRLRLSSLEETLVSDALMEGLSKLKHFCPHFHLSLQSGCDTVLQRMNRKYTTEEFYHSVQLIRKYFPKAGITTDVIVGFPGETDAEFEQTVSFIQRVGFASLHIFPYSKREGTVAAKLKDLPPDVKANRCARLEQIKTNLQNNFFNQNKVGTVLIEELQQGYYVGYTENYIRCYVESKNPILNEIVQVKLGKPMLDGVKAKVKKYL